MTKDRSGYARFTTQAHESGFGLLPSSEPVRFSGLHSRVNGWCTRRQAERIRKKGGFAVQGLARRTTGMSPLWCYVEPEGARTGES